MKKKSVKKGSSLQEEISDVRRKSKWQKKFNQAFEEVVGYNYDKFVEFQFHDKRCLLELDKKELQNILSEL